ncbi:MAG: tryptophan synthase subunit alpha [Nitrospirae bacterium]|nr:tryptophan synthase subunit alpha [Nitrospirota bacterium]
MSGIQRRLRSLRGRGRKALVPFVTAGDPDLRFTEAVIPELERAGADMIEIGVPFSDPVADGVVIQASAQRALKKGVSLRKVLALVRRVRPKVSCPLILMGYANPFLSYGIERVARDAAASGVDGFILIDLPPEEAEPARRAFKSRGLDLIFLLTPASPKERIALVARQASGFIYFVSYTGVTGAGTARDKQVAPHVRRIRARSKLPVLIGFGIRDPKQARALAHSADGVAVGTALIKEIEKAASAKSRLARAHSFVGSIRKALDS